jgi:hypothetical protein
MEVTDFTLSLEPGATRPAGGATRPSFSHESVVKAFTTEGTHCPSKLNETRPESVAQSGTISDNVRRPANRSYAMKKLTTTRPKATAAILFLGVTAAAFATATAANLKVPADYPTIQSAVDAAVNGDRIQIAAGVYTGQVLISDKRLTLAGAAGTVLRAAPGMNQPYLAFGTRRVPLLGLLRSDVVVSGLTLEGGRLGDSQADGWLTGIFFLGSSGRLEDCRITGFRGGTLDSAPEVVAVFIVDPVLLGTGPVNVRVVRNTFADNGASIVLLGDITDPTLLRTTFAVNDNIITGNGPDATGTQEGLQIGTGVSGEVMRNTITDHAYVGSADPLPFSLGILANNNLDSVTALQPSRFEGNILRNNQLHMTLLHVDGSSVVNNSFEGTAPGLRPTGLMVSGDNVLVAANRFSDMPLGVLLFGDDPDFGTIFGLATNAGLLGNQFCHVTESIVSEPLVTGTQEHGNRPNACQPTPHENEQ